MRGAHEVQFVQAASAASAARQNVIEAFAVKPIGCDRIDCFVAQSEQSERFAGGV